MQMSKYAGKLSHLLYAILLVRDPGEMEPKVLASELMPMASPVLPF